MNEKGEEHLISGHNCSLFITTPISTNCMHPSSHLDVEFFDQRFIYPFLHLVDFFIGQ